MKQFNKLLLLIACLTISNSIFSMKIDNAEEIENIKDQIEKLEARLAVLEKQKASTTTTTATGPARQTGPSRAPRTFKKCRGDFCKIISAPEYRDLRRNPRYTCKGGVCKRKKHSTLQEQFLSLEKKYDIETTPAEMKKIYPIRGHQGSQVQFNAVRSALNTLLLKAQLSDSDIATIKQKISELRRLNPARWPRAQDYQRILDARQ